MPEWKYPHNESLLRIADTLEGNQQTSSVPGEYTGEMPAWNDSLSKIARLLEGSEDGLDLALPGMEYGGIYSTGTSQLTYSLNTWTKVTGTFQSEMQSSDNVTPNVATDNLVALSRDGNYFVGYDVSFIGGVNATYQFVLYVDGVLATQTEQADTTPASGSLTTHVNNVAGGGIVQVAAQPANVELYFKADVTGTLSIRFAQIALWNVGLATGQ